MELVGEPCRGEMGVMLSHRQNRSLGVRRYSFALPKPLHVNVRIPESFFRLDARRIANQG